MGKVSSTEKAIAYLNVAKAIGVLEPFIVQIAYTALEEQGKRADLKEAQDEVKAAKGKTYDHVRAAIIAAAESDVEAEALAEAFKQGLLAQRLETNTVSPYAGTLRQAVPALREGRVTVEQVNSLDMTKLREACKDEDALVKQALRNGIAKNVKMLTVDELTTLAMQLDELTRERREAKDKKA